MDWIQSVYQALTRIEGLLWPLAHPDKVVASLLEDSLGLLLKVWFGFILRTTDFETGKDFVSNVTIHRFEPALQLVADSALVLVVIIACYKLMWGHGVRSQYTVRILLPRLMMGTLLINFSMPLFQLAVQGSNAACEAIQSFGTIPNWNTWWDNYRLDQTHGVWQFVTTGALVAGYDVLAIAYLIRYAILIVLAITAPLAGLLFTLPDTHYLAKHWASLFVTNLLMQPAQLFVLSIGFALENGGHTPVHHLFALASLVIVFKVPGALGGAEKTAHKLESAFATGLHGLQHAVTRAA
ncbi:MAG: hypothetical protein ABI959_01495 [Candidatus Dormiibacterota bacterium]